MMRPADRTLRVAIVGAGLMGRWHAFSAARAGGSIVAVVDPNQARARRLASRSRAARAFSTLDGALERADVVHVCTPTAAHVAVIAQALDARRHVLVEKPLAPTVAETIE